MAAEGEAHRQRRKEEEENDGWRLVFCGEKEKAKIRLCDWHYVAHGVFGTVYSANLTAEDGSKNKVAVKKVWLSEGDVQLRQVTINRDLNHDNLVRLLYFYTKTYPRRDCWSLVMDFMPTTCNEYWDMECESGPRGRHLRFPHPFIVKLWTYQLLRGLNYLQRCCYPPIMHRDVKPDNMLLDPSTHLVKLGDFGSAKRVGYRNANHHYMVTRYYRPPEMLLGSKSYGVEVDVWSAGAILAGFVKGDVLWAGNNSSAQFDLIQKVLGSPTKQEVEAMLKNKEKPVIQWKDTYERRPIAMYEALGPCRRYEGPDVTAVSLLRMLLNYDPSQRLSTTRAAKHVYFDDLRKCGGKNTATGGPMPIKIAGAEQRSKAIVSARMRAASVRRRHERATGRQSQTDSGKASTTSRFEQPRRLPPSVYSRWLPFRDEPNKRKKSSSEKGKKNSSEKGKKNSSEKRKNNNSEKGKNNNSEKRKSSSDIE